jgi:TRAP-type C4-dicarboxylate transport system substrate-binding protein
MRKNITGYVLAVGFVLCLFFRPGFAAEKAISLEFSSQLPATEKMSLTLAEWSREVEKRTNGRVKVTYHPGSTMTTPPQTFDSVMSGIVDIGFGPNGATRGRFPVSEVVDLPWGLKSSYTATNLLNDLVNKFKPKELANVKLLFMLSSPPAVIQSKKPIRNLEALKGFKLHCIGGTSVKVAESLGAVPVVLSSGDLYDALQKGIAGGSFIVYDAITSYKWEDTLTYTTANYATSLVNNGYFVMNKSVWESLPGDIQQIIDNMSREYQEKISKLWDQKERDSIAALTAKGHKTITLSKAEEEKWASRITPLYEDYVKEKSARGLPAPEILAFCKSWIKKNQK